MIPDHPLLTNLMDLLVDTICVVDEEGRYVFISAACSDLLGYMPEELIGRNMIELVHPDDRERTLQAAANVMRGQPHIHFENRYVRKDGCIIDIMWSARWLESERLRLAVARDVKVLRHAARVHSALYRISEAAHSADGLFALYQHIQRIIGELLPADNFFVALYDETDDMLSFPYFVDEREPEPEPHPPGSGTPIARVIQSGEALLTGTGTGSAPATWLGVPLISQNGVMGALVVQVYFDSKGYTDEDKNLLQFVSTQIAAAIERKQAETRLRRMARYDALTDLPNRALFQDRLDTAVKRAHRDCELLALLYLDVDKFKYINDNFGHQTGDLLLREVARRLVQCVRASDTVGRMGGDEFTVLLIDIREPACAEMIMGKIHAAIAAPFKLGEQTLTISASIGFAVYPENGGDREQLFRHADTSMYAVKRKRRAIARTNATSGE